MIRRTSIGFSSGIASPKLIPNEHAIINNSGSPHEDLPARIKPTVVPPTLPMFHSPSSSKTKPTGLINQSHDDHTAFFLSASDENKCYFSIESETGGRENGKLRRAPPNFVAPNLPDPAPPPLPLERGLILYRKNSSLALYSKVLKIDVFLNDQLGKRNLAYQCRREREGECHVRDENTIGRRLAASHRRVVEITGLYHNTYAQARIH